MKGIWSPYMSQRIHFSKINENKNSYKEVVIWTRLERPVITLTIDQFILNPKSILLISSYRIPSQKKVKAEKIRKICEKI